MACVNRLHHSCSIILDDRIQQCNPSVRYLCVKLGRHYSVSVLIALFVCHFVCLFVSHFMSLFLPLSLSLSLSLSLYLSLYVSVFPSLSFLFLSVCLSLSRFSVSVCLSPSLCLSVSFSICLCLSLCLSFSVYLSLPPPPPCLHHNKRLGYRNWKSPCKDSNQHRWNWTCCCRLLVTALCSSVIKDLVVGRLLFQALCETYHGDRSAPIDLPDTTRR